MVCVENCSKRATNLAKHEIVLCLLESDEFQKMLGGEGFAGASIGVVKRESKHGFAGHKLRVCMGKPGQTCTAATERETVPEN